jgi:hypothetical protein
MSLESLELQRIIREMASENISNKIIDKLKSFHSRLDLLESERQNSVTF